jgi:phosphoribosylaminoimidazole-succinocarboxamide synthase
MAPLTTLDLPGIRKWKSGKVREVFEVGDELLIVATDRISAFDCILPTGIPDKGRVLNRLSAWWFRRLEGRVPHHMIGIEPEDWPTVLAPHADILRGRAMLARRVAMLPIEGVVRGYLAGSGWKEYSRHGTVCGMPLRKGYRESERLDEPIFTPTTKAETGHDENISFERMAQIVGPDLAEQVRATALALYRDAAAYALTRGIIIADTKFEFGRIGDRLVLADEALTPDSSRFWPADQYEPGGHPPSFDKQFVRDYLESLDWDKTPPAPPLPEEVVRRTSEKYREAYRRITGTDLE